MELMQESVESADEVVEHLKKMGVDISAHHGEIAKDVFDDGLLNGNWDSSISVGGYHIRAINEDEYEQHMEDNEHADDVPNRDDMAFEGRLGFVWITKE